MRNLSDFERGQIVGVCSAGVPVTNTAPTVLGAWMVTVSKVMSVFKDHRKISAESSGQK
jgi:hypothetical protein